MKKSYFLLNFLMFCLGATVGRRIGDSYIMCHLAAKSADSVLMNLPHSRDPKVDKNARKVEICFLPGKKPMVF
jgi:hypothetical protein